MTVLCHESARFQYVWWARRAEGVGTPRPCLRPPAAHLFFFPALTLGGTVTSGLLRAQGIMSGMYH